MDRFDEVLLYRELNMDKSYMMSYPVGIIPFLNFVMYGILHEIPDKELKNHKEDFIRGAMELGNGDLITEILNSDISIPLKKAYLDLLIDDIDITELTIDENAMSERKEMLEESRRTNKKKADQLLKTLDTDEGLFNIKDMRIPKDMIRRIHIDYSKPDSMLMQFIDGKGVFLSLGYDFHIPERKDIDVETVRETLKVLGDTTRFGILLSILQGDQTPTEISRSVKVSLSTVNYHMKQLIEAGLICVFLNGSRSRRETFSVNTEYILDIMSHIRMVLGKNGEISK